MAANTATAMEVTIGPATSFAAAFILLVLLLVAAQLCLTINSVQVSLRRRYWPRRAAQFLPWVVVPSLTGGAARRFLGPKLNLGVGFDPGYPRIGRARGRAARARRSKPPKRRFFTACDDWHRW